MKGQAAHAVYVKKEEAQEVDSHRKQQLKEGENEDHQRPYAVREGKAPRKRSTSKSTPTGRITILKMPYTNFQSGWTIS